jgi:hypothetical protein
VNKSCSIDKLIATTRSSWRDSGHDSSDVIHDGPGSAEQPLILSNETSSVGGLQSVHEFSSWSLGDDDSGDTRMAAA